MLRMKSVLWVAALTLAASGRCAPDICGKFGQLPKKIAPGVPGENPCNPLYWYPQPIPDHCHTPPTHNGKPYPVIPFPMPPPPPLMQIPVPPLPYGVPIVPSAPMVPVGGFPFPYMPPMPFVPPLGPPMHPPFLPPAHYVHTPPFGPPMPSFMPPSPMAIPGLPGLGGGINILPMTDVYADMWERLKQIELTKKLEKLVGRYESPWDGGIFRRRGRRRD